VFVATQSPGTKTLVQLYEATGNQDEAAKWRKVLETLKTAKKK
jgi:ribosomal protein L18E